MDLCFHSNFSSSKRSGLPSACAIVLTGTWRLLRKRVSTHGKGNFLKTHIVGLVDFDDCGDCAGCSDNFDMIDFQKQIQQIPDLLKVAEMRHQVLSQNLANANTPGYHRLDVDFEAHLAEVMSGQKSAESLVPKIIEDNSGSMRADGNNVSVEKEVGQLGKNAMLYQMYTELLNSQFRSMQQAMEMP